MTRREFITLLGGAAAWPLAARAQQPATRTYRVGIVWANTPIVSASRFATFRQGLHELGYVEGKNIVFMQRGPDRTLQEQVLISLVAELVSQKMDVILTAGTSPTQAAKSVTGTIPVVMTFVSDPIGSGFVNSLARPGGNITGLTNFGPEMSVKWLELLKDLTPNAHRIAVLYDSAVRFLVNGMERAATATGVALFGKTVAGFAVDAGRLTVAHLADHQHVGILSQDASERRAEGHSRLDVDWDLRDAL